MNLDLLIIVGTAYVGNALIFGWLQALPYTITIVAASAAIWLLLVLGCIL